VNREIVEMKLSVFVVWYKEVVVSHTMIYVDRKIIYVESLNHQYTKPVLLHLVNAMIEKLGICSED